MIIVSDIFYEKGFSIDGKANRIMLKKNDEILIEMIFLGEEVELIGYDKNEPKHNYKANLNEICSITVDNENPPGPAIILY